MANLMALILAGLPQALMAIGAKIFTEAFFQKILTQIILAAAYHAAALTTNKVDDDLVKQLDVALHTPAPK